MQNTGIIGAQDPYVTATMMPSGAVVECIEPAMGGGTCPDWSLDNVMRLPIAITDSSVLLQVLARNLASEDETIGSVEISLTEQDLKFDTAVWRELDSGGELECTIRMPDGRKGAGRAISLEIFGGECMRDLCMVGKMDPYVIAYMLPDKQSTARTKASVGGGTEPRWDNSMNNKLILNVMEGDDLVLLEVRIENAGSFGDDLVGSVELELPKSEQKAEAAIFQLDTGGTLECLIRCIDSLDQVDNMHETEGEISLLTRMKQKSCRQQITLSDTEAMNLDDNEPPAKVQKSPEVSATILEAINSHFLFDDCDDAEKEQLVNAMIGKEVVQGEAIITQGEVGDHMFVVEEGSMDVLVDGRKVAVKEKGDLFGELALLYNSSRTASIVVGSEEGQLWGLDRKTFRSVLARNAHRKKTMAIGMVRQVPLLEALTDEQLNKVAEVISTMTFAKGQVLINKGTIGQVFYIIQSGNVRVTDLGGGLSDYILSPGDYFGERALMMDELRKAKVVAEGPVTCLVLDRDSFTKLLGPLREVLNHNLSVRVLKSVQILQTLTEDQREVVISSLMANTAKFSKDEYIVTQGSPGDVFYIVSAGRARVTKNGADATDQEDEVPITVLTVGNYFGELSLLKNITRAANVIAETEVECFTMSRANFEQLLGPLKELIGEGAVSRTKEMASRMRANLKFEDLVTAREMMSGFFGHCRLAEDGQTGDVYLLRVMHKADIVQNNQQVSVVNEKKVTISCEHEFIADQLGTFKNEVCLCCLMGLPQVRARCFC
jgi:CRP-like cAMP-binding protein